MPLSRLVLFQTERPAYKLDCSWRYLRLPADALVCKRRKTKCETEENTLGRSPKGLLLLVFSAQLESGLQRSGSAGGKRERRVLLREVFASRT